MFTGLVEATGTVEALVETSSGARLAVDSPIVAYELGESVSVNGACLTVVESKAGRFVADLSSETLDKTTLGTLTRGSTVNLERSLQVGARLGGHWVLGHVDRVVSVARFEPRGDARYMAIRLDQDLLHLVAEKGSVTLDGVSLTVNEVSADGFSVMLIPHTLEATGLHRVSVGQRVNFEADVLARYVARLYELGRAPAVSASGGDDRLMQSLREAGFVSPTPKGSS
jgi:riboflavin synthase